MKGILFRHRSMVGFGRLRNVISLVIPERENLAISLFEDRISAHFGFETDVDFENLGEVEVPEELIETAANFAKANAAMTKAKDRFRTLMEG